MTRPASFLTLFAWAALQGYGQAETPVPTAFSAAKWEPVFQGVDHTAIILTDPRPLKIQVLRVNLDTAGVSLLATPDNGDAPGETSSLRTSNFLKAMKCQAAINAGPFDVVSTMEGKAMNVSGLQVAGGKIVSPDNGYPALIFSRDRKVRIQRTPFPEKDIQEAVSGFQVILWNGKVTASDVKLHPRTGAGVSGDGKTLWLLVADGRQAGVSEGCTTVEMAAWFLTMGSTSALNLDGGGTTTMVLAKADGSPHILNRPIHAGIPGLERPAGSHLGIRALPLESAAK